MQIHNHRSRSLIVNVFTILVTSIILTGCFAFSSGQSDEQPISSVSEGKAEPIINKNGAITEYAPPLSLSQKARLSSVIVIGQVE